MVSQVKQVRRLKRLPSAGFFVVCSCVLVIAAGCEAQRAAPLDQDALAPPVPVAPATPPAGISASELRRRLGANENAQFDRSGGDITRVDLYDSGVTDLTPLRGMNLVAVGISGLDVTDLSPLEGMPLELLTAENSAVVDLSPLAGMPLTELYLRETKVADLSPIASAPISKLNIVGTQVADLSAVKAMPLDTLWAGSTKVRDLSPLTGKRLVSLDIEESPIDDLSALADMSSLRRLNIAKSSVKDLSPLAGLNLERLIFTPSNIERGIEAVKGTSSLREIGTSFEAVMPVAEFWQQYDAGAFSESAQP